MGKPLAPLTLTVYSDDQGPSTLKDPRGSLLEISKLSFSSGLPGGFLEASFTITGVSARALCLRAGLAVAISQGRSVLWWGWIEDLERVVRGKLLAIEVTCLGPWQELEQRYFSGTYTDVGGIGLLLDTLHANCPHISLDTSLVVGSGPTVSLNWSRKKISELVKLVCEGGSEGIPMVFTIVEPTYAKARIGSSANLLSDSGQELTSDYWYLVDGTYADWTTLSYHSAYTSMMFSEFAVDGLAYKYKVPVAAGTQYAIDYWHKWSAHSSMTVYTRIDWYTAADTFISSTSGTTFTSDGVNTAWTQRTDVHTSPALAATARPMVGVTIGAGATRQTAVDDVRFYRATSSTSDRFPRIRLRTKDLTTADYLLFTRGLGTPYSEVQTTRNLANYIEVGYGSSSVTTPGEDEASQDLYRQRDLFTSITSSSATAANNQRDALLLSRSEPSFEPSSFEVPYGSLFGPSRKLVDPVFLRAGDRVQIGDGPNRGTILSLNSVSFKNGVVKCQPESRDDIATLLARR